eukprot:COSAG06_NODE_3480_length_5282_cov_28.899093_6_plen_217_part_00
MHHRRARTSFQQPPAQPQRVGSVGCSALTCAPYTTPFPARRYVREGAYAPQWQKVDENRWPGTPTGRAGRGPSIDIQKAMNQTRFVGVRNPTSAAVRAHARCAETSRSRPPHLWLRDSWLRLVPLRRMTVRRRLRTTYRWAQAPVRRLSGSRALSGQVTMSARLAATSAALSRHRVRCTARGARIYAPASDASRSLKRTAIRRRAHAGTAGMSCGN